jgi:hypothetical protein
MRVGLDGDGVVVDELGLAVDEPDVVAAELLAHDRGLGGDDARGPIHELPQHLVLGGLHARRVEHVERPLGQLLDDRLAQGLRRDRPGVDRDAAEAVPPLDHGDPLAELRGLDRRLLAARPGAHDDEIDLHGAESYPRGEFGCLTS